MTRQSALILFAIALPAAAQQWEIGGSGGVGVFQNLTVDRGGQSASAGFKIGPALGAWAGQNLYRHLGGEFRYTFQFDDLKVSSGGAEATFSGVSHAVHYNLVIEGNRESQIRPFVSGGGGVRLYRGTGKEASIQPLMNYALLTKTQEVKGLLSVGGGFKVQVGRRGLLRAEVLAYFTPAPTQVIAPAPGAKLGGWVKEFVPMLGLGFTF